MFRTFLSLRYLRARKTNWIGVAGIFVAVTALILILSIMAGFLAESRSHLRGNLADVIVTPALDRPIDDGALPSRDVDALIERIEAIPGVAAAAPQLQWYGLIAPSFRDDAFEAPLGGLISLVELVGIDLEREVRVTDFGESLRRDYQVRVPTAGRPDDPDDPFARPRVYRPSGRPREAMVVGEQLAASWGLFKGEEVPVLTATYDEETRKIHDEPANQPFVVAGTFRSENNEMDLQRAYFDRRALADFLGGQKDFTSVLVRLEDYERDKRTVPLAIWEDLHGAGFLHAPGEYPSEIRTWEQFRITMLKAIENEKRLMAIMLSLVLVVAGFTIFALLSMMVSEKRRDIGILCALGATQRGVLALFLLIGAWQALLGAGLGVVVGVLAALNIGAIEDWLDRALGVQVFDRSVYYFDHLPSEVRPWGVALIAVGAVVLTLLFAAIPAWRAARLDPVDALRYE